MVAVVETLVGGVPRRRTALVLATALLAGCGLGDEPTPTTGEEVSAGGSSVLVWGDGDRGVVLAHGASFDAASWEEQARAMAGRGLTVAAVEDLSAKAIVDAVGYLTAERGVSTVGLVGSSAGATPVVEAAAADPTLADGIVLLSPAGGDVEALGSIPSLFVYSEGEELANQVAAMADAAPGPDVEVLVVPGDAHAQGIFRTDQADEVLDAVIDRLG